MLVLFHFLFAGPALLLGAILPVQITLSNGTQSQGNLTAITSSVVVVEVAGTPQEIPLDGILSVTQTNFEKSVGPIARVITRDGSQIAAQSLKMENDILRIELRGQDDLDVPIKQIRAVRLHAPSASLDAQWLGLIDQESTGDRLVIRREGDHLDEVQGVIEAITDNAVRFTVDANTVQAPFDRLEGIVFGSPKTKATFAPIQVVDAYGSRWGVYQVKSSKDGSSIELNLQGELRHQFPLSQIESIQWSGSLVMLSSQTPAATSYQPYLENAAIGSSLRIWFGPREENNEDLMLRGDSIIEYRIDSGFERVAGSVVRSNEVEHAGQIEVSIDLDDKNVWTESLTGSEQRGFELPIADARRVRFRVKTMNDGDIGDSVLIHRPRLTK